MWRVCPDQAFDPLGGGPRQSIEMEAWPRMERMTETFGATIGRALLESFYATASTEGLSVIFNRCVPGRIPHQKSSLQLAMAISRAPFMSLTCTCAMLLLS